MDNDPIVHVHANALLTGSGTTGIVLADLRKPEAILAHPKVRALIDFARPVALLLVAIVHFLTDGRTRPGSWPRCGTRCRQAATWRCRTERRISSSPGVAGRAAAVYEQATAPFVLRPFKQVAAFFGGSAAR